MVTSVLELARPDIRRMQAYESARSLIRSAEVYLDANESPWPNEESPGMNRYPEPQPRALVQALSSLYGVEPSSIFLGRGTDDAIDALVRTFCQAGRDAIAICPPTYGMYEVAATIQGADVRRFVTVPPDFSIPAREILEAWVPEMKLVFLCSPNNPTGNCIPRETIADICTKLSGKAVVVVDEAYIEFAPGLTVLAELSRFPNLVVLRTLSKAWALAGARCGSAIGHPDVIGLLQKVRAPYPLSEPSAQVVLKALSAEGSAATVRRVARLCEQREWLRTELLRLPMGLEVFPSQANFLLVKVKNALALRHACLRQGIVVRDRSREPGLMGCVRISVGTLEENQRLLSALETLGKEEGENHGH